MAEIINLRQARKQRARAAAERKADANRAHFGRTGAEKQASRMENDRQARKLDGAKREDGDHPGKNEG